MTLVSVVVVGAGARAAGYARWAGRHPDRASVVAVAEPLEVRRARFAAEHGIAAGNAVADWRQRAGQARRRGLDLHTGPDARRAGRGVRRALLSHPAGKADGAGRGGVPADRG